MYDLGMDKQPDTESTTNGKRGRINKLAFLGLFLPMAALVAVIGISLASARMEARINEMLEHDGTQLHLVSGFLGTEILEALKHLRSLSTEAITLEALDSPEPAQLRLLEFSFLTLAQRNPLYQQVRWIDETGMERVRITRDKGELHVAAPENLQDKSDRYYFNESNVLLPGELFVSRLDLNEEYGQIEMPPRPMLRIATPVADSDRERRGIIVINIEMKYLFDFARNMEQADKVAEYLLVNQQGILLNEDFLKVLAVDEDEQDAGGIEPAVDEESPGLDFAALQPELWEKVSTEDTGSLEAADGLWTWRKMSPVDTLKQLTRVFPEHLVTFDQMIHDNFSLTLLAHRPVGTMEDVRSENRLLMSLGIIFTLSVYGVTLFFYLSGTARARRLEQDAASAKERASDMARMKELEERFHRLVEASTIGQLVVDSEGCIVISNHAAEQMLGYQKWELQGTSVDALLPESLREKHVGLRAEYMQAPEARRMNEGRELWAVRKDGIQVPVEVGLSPYSDEGQPMVLANIIDLSHRKG